MTSAARYLLSSLLELWKRSRFRKAILIMLSPLVQIYQSPQHTARSRKRSRHAVEPVTVLQKSMDDFGKELKDLFEQPLSLERLTAISSGLREEYKGHLQTSKISMLPSYQHTLPSGDELGDYLALDVGGSTFRIALVGLQGREIRTSRMRIFPITETIRRLQGERFFDWMADRIEEILTEYNHIVGMSDTAYTLPMGVAWSFPIEQTSSRSGRLLAMGKGFCATLGCEGEDLNDLIMKPCRRKNLNVEMQAIVNDGAATLLSQAYKDPSARISLILGTGMNAAVYLPVSALAYEKFGQRPDSWHSAAEHVLVNTELSMFGKQLWPVTRFDEELNRNHRLPDFQPLEYLVTGRYIGEIVRLILVEAIQRCSLFNGQMPEDLSEPYAFDTRIVAAFESDSSDTLSTSCDVFLASHRLRSKPHISELKFIQQVAKLVSQRAEAFLAAALHALWSLRTAAEGIEPGEASHVSIACDGTIVERYPDFRASCQDYLDKLTEVSGAVAGAITLEMAPESSIFGAAVAVCCSKES